MNKKNDIQYEFKPYKIIIPWHCGLEIDLFTRLLYFMDTASIKNLMHFFFFCWIVLTYKPVEYIPEKKKCTSLPQEK